MTIKMFGYLMRRPGNARWIPTKYQIGPTGLIFQTGQDQSDAATCCSQYEYY